MTIKFSCSCGKVYKVPERYAGKRVNCKRCQNTIRIPSDTTEGVTSQRAEVVSARSVLASDRTKQVEAGAKSGRISSRAGAAEAPAAAQPAGASTSTRKPAASAPPKSAAAPVKTAPAAKKPKPRGPDDTQELQVRDISRELKRFSQKKKGDPVPAGRARLVRFDHDKPVRAYDLDKAQKTLGRDADCEIQISDKSVSRRHAKFEYALGTFIATDLGSTNGLVVNGEKKRRVGLKDGDIIQAGELIFRIDTV